MWVDDGGEVWLNLGMAMTATTTSTETKTIVPKPGTAGRKEAVMAKSKTHTPNPLDGVHPRSLADAVRILRPERPHVIAPCSVTVEGEYGPVTILDNDSVQPEPGTYGVTVAQLYRLHCAGEGWRFGPKGCPFCR